MKLYRFFDPELCVGSYWSEDYEYMQIQAKKYLLEIQTEAVLEVQMIDTDKVFMIEPGYDSENIRETISKIYNE